MSGRLAVLSQDISSEMIQYAGAKIRSAAIVAFQNPMMPLIVLDHFAHSFPEQQAYWGVAKEGYTARFKSPSSGLTNVVIYDTHGKILRYEQEVDNNCCPAPIVEFLTKRFNSTDIPVWSCQEDSEVSYYVKKGMRIYWFDKQGFYKGARGNWLGTQKTYM
jgi:hypothetical protein